MKEPCGNPHARGRPDHPLVSFAPTDPGDVIVWHGLPPLGRLRWLAPAGLGLRNAICLSTPSVRAQRIALTCFAGLADHFPRLRGMARRVSLSQQRLDDCMAELGMTRVTAMSIGTPGPRQRLTLMGNLHDGQACIAKIAHGPQGDSACRSEAGVLKSLSADDWWKSRVPVLLCSGDWMGRAFILQTLLPGRPLENRDVATLIGLAKEAPVSGTITLNEWVNRDSLTMVGMESLTSLSAVQRLMAEPIAAGWVHGDWARWNACKTTSGQILIFDWEMAAPDMPRCLDIGMALMCERILLGRSPSDLSPIAILAAAIWVRQHWHDVDWRRCCRWVRDVLTSC